MGKNHAVVVGGGIGGLGVAALLAKSGYEVDLFEKNSTLGGVCNFFEVQSPKSKVESFRFDTGPSFYMMPDAFDRFFELLGERRADHYATERLSPSFRAFFESTGEVLDLHSDLEKDIAVFEKLEPGVGRRVRHYYRNAEKKFRFAEAYMQEDWRRLLRPLPLRLFSSVDQYLRRQFFSADLRTLLSYPMTFLGASPKQVPALFSFMSYADLGLGVWEVKGGMYEVVKALVRAGERLGVRYHTNAPIEKIVVEGSRARELVLASGERVCADIVVSNADMNFTETKLLPPEARTYSDRYWATRKSAYSALLIFLGLSEEPASLIHHNFYFSKDPSAHFDDIDAGTLPADPSLYVKKEGKTLFVLVPMPCSLDVPPDYVNRIIQSIEKKMKAPELSQKIMFKKVFTSTDFAESYNMFRGSALGLAHTLTQSAFFRPGQRSKKVKNLYYVGAGTNPGIGLPTVLASAEAVWRRIVK